MNPDEADIVKQVVKIVEEHGPYTKSLIPILQDIQEEYGYVPGVAIATIAGRLGISGDVIYGVTTFYSQFRFNPPGRHHIKACLGTACHVRRGSMLLEAIERRLGISHGETTPDGLFSLEKVACLGCCALAPVIVVDDQVFGTCTPAKVDGILSRYEGEGCA